MMDAEPKYSVKICHLCGEKSYERNVAEFAEHVKRPAWYQELWITIAVDDDLCVQSPTFYEGSVRA